MISLTAFFLSVELLVVGFADRVTYKVTKISNRCIGAIVYNQLEE